MAAQGFTAYLEEWWHFDYGDQFWGLATGRAACYAGNAGLRRRGIPLMRAARAPLLGSGVSEPRRLAWSHPADRHPPRGTERPRAPFRPTPPGWEDYRAARERFLRTLQIDSLNRLLARPDAGPGRFEPGDAR